MMHGVACRTEPEEHAEPVSRVQFWWVTGPDGEVLGKLCAEFSDEEIRLLGSV